MTLQIYRMHRSDIRSWKAAKLNALLPLSSHWRRVKYLAFKFSGTKAAQHPLPDEIAFDLANLFAGAPLVPQRPVDLTETPWTLEELLKTLQRMKSNKAADENGLVAELLKYVPIEYLELLLNSFNRVLSHGNTPSTWHKTIFKMLAKCSRAKVTADFRPIANISLFYKTFAYMILGPVEDCLDAAQPEEQHGFRRGRRLEEHLLTANLVLDKSLAVGMPIWVISVDFSKAFDRVLWPALWQALLQAGVSEHLVWIIQQMYVGQQGAVRGDDGTESHGFDICAGVRQGCVLSPRLFCAALQSGMGDWRAHVGPAGLDLGDGMRPLLDLRLADDVLIFAKSRQEISLLLAELVRQCARVGLILNAEKTKILTTEAQAPCQLTTPAGMSVDVLSGLSTHKWLGSLLSSRGSGHTAADVEFHLSSASRAFYASRQTLCDMNVSILHRLRYFDAVVSPVACFAAGHRAVHQGDLNRLDVAFRKHLRQLVGPPANIQWDAPWHEILHEWNARAMEYWARTSHPSWSQNCLQQHWKLALHAGHLSHDAG